MPAPARRSLAESTLYLLHGVVSRRTAGATARHEFLHAGGWLVLGGITAATLQVLVHRTVLDAVAGNEWVAIPRASSAHVCAGHLLEGRGLVATGLNHFSLTSRLVCLVVGPAVDLKLVALQAGVFGRGFALRFAPMAFIVAVMVTTLVGWAVL